jgi:ubiquinone/menaquinone biosynthesis C-methylase UbiE
MYYDKYRPRYPEGILDFMKMELGFSSASTVADVGSGTGILCELLLKNGNFVFGVEPNSAMKDIAEAILSRYPNFRSVNGCAEATTLPSASVDFITAAQSFHWFDASKARVEFSRILKPEGWVILIWNTRNMSTAFMRAYEQLVQDFADKPTRVRHEDVGEKGIRDFLGEYKKRIFRNAQVLDLAGLEGRLLSSSYSPLPGDPRHSAMLKELRSIFDSHQKEGYVQLEYNTELFCAQFTN